MNRTEYLALLERTRRISQTGMRLIYALCLRPRDAEGYITIGRAELAADLGVCEASITTAVAACVEERFLQVVKPTKEARQQGATAKYRPLLILAGASDDAETSPARSAPGPQARELQPAINVANLPPAKTSSSLSPAEWLQVTALTLTVDGAGEALAAARCGNTGALTLLSIEPAERALLQRAAQASYQDPPRVELTTPPAAQPQNVDATAEAMATTRHLVTARTAWGRIRAALGATDRARAVLAEILWSSSAGQLAKLGRKGIDVGLHLVEESRWSPPSHMPPTAYRQTMHDFQDWLYA